MISFAPQSIAATTVQPSSSLLAASQPSSPSPASSSQPYSSSQPSSSQPSSPPATSQPSSSSQPPSSPPPSSRSRRFALLPPPPDPPSSPPVPARSPLRPTPRPPLDAPAPPPDPALSKRKHALIELLSSERAYASDLALIRDIHIPLALGLPAPFLASSAPTTTPPPTPHLPPMSKEDTKIIFGNVEELAVFSEVFCDKLQAALAGVLDSDGDGSDRVADLFLSMIPHMKPPYTTYITRHPSAVAHLNALPQSPALAAYLAQTHTLAQSYTHAWDLPSLLIKPVQRLLKYPLLLAAIMNDTPPGEAKDRLREARDQVEEVARGVNEGRRRWDVVKNLLDGKHPPPVRLKSIKGFKLRSGSKDDRGQLDMLEQRVHACKAFVQDFARDIVDWTISLHDCITQLERWAATFGRVIGLGQQHGSEALDVFTEIVSSQIAPIWISLDAAIRTNLLPKLARLLATTAQPLLLLEHMHALLPQHLLLRESQLSKARPPHSLVEASQSYLALEAQLRNELPRYIEILERGFTVCIGQFADWQARFWKEVRGQWVELWDALSIEGDMTAGAADTVKVWWERWEEIDASAAKLGIIKPRRDRASRASQSPGPSAALATAFVGGPAPHASSSPSSPTTSKSRHSIQSIDLEIDMHVLGGVSPRGSGSSSHDVMVMSPNSISSYGAISKGEGTGTPVSLRDDGPTLRQSGADTTHAIYRRESERLPAGRDHKMPARHASNRLPVVRMAGDRPSAAARPSTPRLGTRPAIARGDTDGDVNVRQDMSSQKKSADAAAGLQSFHPMHSSPRVSVHTSASVSESEESASSSLLSNHRLSMQSVDVHIGMDMHASQRSASRGSHSQSQSQVLPTRASGTTASLASNGGLTASRSPSVFVESASSTPGNKQQVLLQNGAAAAACFPEARGRMLKKPSMRKRFADAFRSPSKRPATPRTAGAQSFPVPERPLSSSPPPPQQQQPPPPPISPVPESTDHPHDAVVMYTCTVVHPFSLPGHALPQYRGLPFLALRVEDTVEILSEEGHPRDHEELPIRPEDDDVDDCLLLGRDTENGTVGWALASFLVISS